MKPSREFLITLVATLVLGTAAVAAVLVWKHRESQDPDAQVYIAPEVELSREAQWLQEYIRIDTSNPPGNETRGAQFLQRILEQHGVASEIIEPAPGRGSLYARVAGREQGDALMLMHHIDVVPATEEGWREGPFSGAVRQGYLWGRGALDMKGIGIAHLAAFLDIATGAEPPRRDVVFLAVADEEAGGALGMEWLLEHRPDVIEGVSVVLTEGGITEMTREQVIYFGIEVASRLFSAFTFTAADRRELEAARLRLEPWLQPIEPDEVLPEVVEYLSAVAGHRLTHRELLADVERAIDEGEYWKLHPEYKDLFRNSVTVSQIGQTPRGDFSMEVVVAHLRTESGRSFLPWLEEVAGPGVSVGETLMMERTEASSTKTEAFGAIRRSAAAIGASAAGPFVSARSTTDCRFLRARGVDCYGFWPYPVDFFQTQMLHGAGERLRLDWFDRGRQMMRELTGELVE